MIQCLFAINKKDSTQRSIPGNEIRLVSFAISAVTLHQQQVHRHSKLRYTQNSQKT